MVKVAPSILSANFVELKKELGRLEDCGAEWIHYDVMDGHFVPNISFGYSILSDIKKVTSLYLDVHLMISDPITYVDHFIQAGASLITFHIEAMKDEEKTMALIQHLQNAKVDIGVSLKPATKVETILPFLKYVDVVLVMSVEPGFGGQSFQAEALDKIKQLAILKEEYHFSIEVDGGINAVTAQQCKSMGADIMVAGSYLFGDDDMKVAMESLR